MKSLFRPTLAALGLLSFLTNCATTVKETEKPTVNSQPMSAPVAVARPDSAGAAATALDASAANTGAAALPDGASSPFSRNATPAEVAAALVADRPDPTAPTAEGAAEERAREKKMTNADYRNMLANADAILKVDPKSSKAMLQRAKAKSYLKKYQDAMPDYATAIRFQRNNPDAYYNRAVNRLMLKQYKAATTDFTSAVKYRPDDKQALFGRGVAKMQMYQYKSAVGDFTQAIKLDSAYADAWEYRGISYASFDRLKDARRDFEMAVSLNPEAKKSMSRYLGNDEGLPKAAKAPSAKK